MSSTAKTAGAALAALAVSVAALTGCTNGPGPTAGATSTASTAAADGKTPTTAPTPNTAGDECRKGTRIVFSKVSADAPMTGSLRGELVDRGPSDGASGTVTDDGNVVTYTVEAGDALPGIGSRFCVDYITVAQYNHVYPTWDIHPGDVLILSPDPSVEWVDSDAS